MIEATHVKNLFCPGLPLLSTLPAASCNGLILIAHDDRKKMMWVLWNPLTQDYYELPKCDADLMLKGCGLGYDCVNDDYKVVRINFLYKTLIYSLKLDSWKHIKDFPGVTTCQHIQGLYLSGSLYWLSHKFIICLDLTTEEYRQLPLPSLHCEEAEQRENWRMKLDVLGGCLVLSFNHISCSCISERFEGWAMKDDGGNITWTKLFSFEKLDDGGWWNVRPITYSKINKHVLLQRHNEFFWLNTDNNFAKKVQIHGSFFSHFSCQVWQGSLFRLGDIVRAKRVERVKRMRAKKRLELKVTMGEAFSYLP